MADTEDPKPDADPQGKTSRQDLFAANAFGYLGGYGYGLNGAPLTQLMPGSGPNGLNYANTFPLIAPLLGSGTFNNTNPYSPPPCYGGYGGVAGFGGMGLNGYGAPWPGTYLIYRIMGADPTLALCYMAVIGAIISCEWSFEADDNAPEGAKDFISSSLLSNRTELLWECCKCLKFGNRAFELVWGLQQHGGKSYMDIVKYKPLLPELTWIKVDEFGGYAGLENGGVTLTADKSFVCVNDMEGDNWYGASRYDNSRRAWSNKLATADNLYKLGTKAASIIPYIGFPNTPDVKDAQGNTISAFQAACSIGSGMQAGKAVVYNNMGNIDPQEFIRLSGSVDGAKNSLWNIDTIDMGDSGPAQLAIIKGLEFWDIQLVRSWLRPERSLLEATKAGSRADSQVHADIGTFDSDTVHTQIVHWLNVGVVNKLLVQNFGQAALNSVKIVNAPVIDAQKIVDDKLLDAALLSPQGMAALFDVIDVKAWLDRTGLPLIPDTDYDESFKAALWQSVQSQIEATQAKTAALQTPQNGRMNGATPGEN